jgi:prepilin-type N-terminal cleavage/methylation domain-containing protein
MTASSRSATTKRLAGRNRGFTLTELAVVFTIVALLLGGLMYTLAAQTEQRDRNDTMRRMEDAKELLIAFAMVNGRLPCPARYVDATNHSNGLESFCIAAAPATCSAPAAMTTTVQAHGNCSNWLDGYLPAVSVGFSGADPTGFALDAWSNRIRYAVAQNVSDPGAACPATGASATVPGFTNATNLKSNNVGCLPADVQVCNTITGASATACAGAAQAVTNANLVAAVVLSTGKNFSTATTAAAATSQGRTDEAANLNGDGVFVFHPPRPETEANQFDDHVIWVPVNLLYARMIAAGVLP